VVNEHSSLTIHPISDAISSRFPHRFIGIFDVMYLICSSGILSRIEVRTTAGATEFIVIFPLFAYSFPNDLLNPITAALLHEYEHIPAFPSLPAILAILQIRPYFVFEKNCRAALFVRKVPSIFTLQTS